MSNKLQLIIALENDIRDQKITTNRELDPRIRELFEGEEIATCQSLARLFYAYDDHLKLILEGMRQRGLI